MAAARTSPPPAPGRRSASTSCWRTSRPSTRRRGASCSSSTWASATRSRSRSPAAGRCSTRRTRASALENLLKTLVCIKRVPETGARITLTADEQAIDTTYLGFTISPHEECAVEEAVRIGGETTVLTLGPRAAEEQLRNALSMGIESAILLETDGGDWSAEATAAAIAGAVGDRGFDLLLFGNEAADTGDYQVGVRVAHALGLPSVTGVKGLEVGDRQVVARREAGGGWEVFE